MRLWLCNNSITERLGVGGGGPSDPLVTANMGKNAVSAYFRSHRRAAEMLAGFYLCWTTNQNEGEKMGGGTESDDRVWQVQKYGPFYY